MKFSGLGVAVISPFTDDNQIDIAALEKITDHLVNNGADFLVLMGTTGESVTLNPSEKTLILKTVKQVNNGRIPIVAGIGGYDTAQIVRQVSEFDPEGISAILSVSPYYNKPSQEGIYLHYAAISKASPLPLILYNVPGRTSSNICPETSCRLAADFPNIVAIKEASANLPQFMAIINNKPADFQVISGDDALTLPLLSLGASGVISVIGNAFPAEFSKMIRLAKNGNPAEAMKIHYQLLDLINLSFEEGSPAESR